MRNHIVLPFSKRNDEAAARSRFNSCNSPLLLLFRRSKCPLHHASRGPPPPCRTGEASRLRHISFPRPRRGKWRTQ
ncbi:hypothetical protein HMPREF9163_02343 [Selenomonas sp. oral taxon 138 str. F0429]|nr:hypothetical protein HMPREF9163_02343 [Selenomonas sp. oral taxon 138 str. F0429]